MTCATQVISVSYVCSGSSSEVLNLLLIRPSLWPPDVLVDAFATVVQHLSHSEGASFHWGHRQRGRGDEEQQELQDAHLCNTRGRTAATTSQRITGESWKKSPLSGPLPAPFSGQFSGQSDWDCICSLYHLLGGSYKPGQIEPIGAAVAIFRLAARGTLFHVSAPTRRVPFRRHISTILWRRDYRETYSAIMGMIWRPSGRTRMHVRIFPGIWGRCPGPQNECVSVLCILFVCVSAFEPSLII